MSAAQKKTSEVAQPLSRGEKRRAAFIAAARQVFLEQGYEAASMSEIVLRAGGSLSTLYAQFGDKQGLFIAMLDARVRRITESAARLFLEMTRSGLVSRALLDEDVRPDADEIRTSVNMVVNMFLHGIIRYQP